MSYAAHKSPRGGAGAKRGLLGLTLAHRPGRCKPHQVLFAGEAVLPDDLFHTPDVSEAEAIKHHRYLRLDALVRMKLTAFRDKDRMHLRVRIDVQLVHEFWCQQVPAELDVPPHRRAYASTLAGKLSRAGRFSTIGKASHAEKRSSTSK